MLQLSFWGQTAPLLGRKPESARGGLTLCFLFCCDGKLIGVEWLARGFKTQFLTSIYTTAYYTGLILKLYGQFCLRLSVSGKDVLTSLPNGYGKSGVYHAALAKFVFLRIKDKGETLSGDHAVGSRAGREEPVGPCYLSTPFLQSLVKKHTVIHQSLICPCRDIYGGKMWAVLPLCVCGPVRYGGWMLYTGRLILGEIVLNTCLLCF